MFGKKDFNKKKSLQMALVDHRTLCKWLRTCC